MVHDDNSYSMITSTTTSSSNKSTSNSSNSSDINYVEKDVMSSVVFCIHHKEGCQWSGQLKKLKGHLNACKFDAIPCLNKCGAQIPRILMEDHLKFTCPLRITICEFCNQDFMATNLEDHIGQCLYEPIDCENKCGSKINRKHLHNHKLNECKMRTINCRYCNHDFLANALILHHSTCSRVPVPCPNRCDLTTRVAREDLEMHLRDHCKSLVMNCQFKDAGCKFKGVRYLLEKHMEESTSQHLKLMNGIVMRQQQQIATLRSTVAHLTTNYNGILVWKINEFQAKMNEAQAKDGTELVSPAFYTSQYGYKLQASLFLNGNGAGENNYLSLYIKILPGEYDALLKWPFSHSVSFTLFDQCPNCPEKSLNIVESFIPDPTWTNFLRPSKQPDTLGFGFPKFVSHELLHKRNFVRDDCIFIRIKIDPSKIIAV